MEHYPYPWDVHMYVCMWYPNPVRKNLGIQFLEYNEYLVGKYKYSKSFVIALLKPYSYLFRAGLKSFAIQLGFVQSANYIYICAYIATSLVKSWQ